MATAALPACNRPELAPDVGYTLLDGRPGTLREHRGQVLLVTFWATSCASCIRKMPHWVAAHHRYQARGYVTLAVAMRHDPPALVARFAESRRLPFGVVIDNTGAVARAFGDVKLTPTTVLIDRQGVIVQRVVGEPDMATLQGQVERLLAVSA
jgi:peroxiredoxin